MIKRINFNDGYTSEVTPSAIIPSGRSIYTGSGVPDNSLGNDGDIYLKADGTIYLKTSGVWNVDSTLLVDVVNNVIDATNDANTAADNANDAAADAAQSIIDAQAAIDAALAEVINEAEAAVADAIADFADVVFVKEKLDLVSDIAINSWITIPNGSSYTTNKISIALNGILLTQDEDYELDVAVGARTQIKILEDLFATDRLTFTIYN